MGNCSSADRRGSFMRKRGRNFPTKDEDMCAYGTQSSLDKEEEDREALMRSDNHTNEKGVVPSDSGIESLGPSTDESPENNCQKCRQHFQCGQQKFLESPCRSEPETYCSCGPRNARLQIWQRNLVCKTHPNSPKFFRHSDIIEVKPTSFRRNKKRGCNRRSNISCKSTDSFDYAGAMLTSMDNAKSVVSDIFGDDVSLQAPLAAFDSVDGQLDSVELSRRERTRSQIEDLTQRICQCEMYTSSNGDLVNQNSSDAHKDRDIWEVRNSYIRESPERKISCINGFTEDVLRTSFSRKNRHGLPVTNGGIVNGDVANVDQVDVELMTQTQNQSVAAVPLRNSIASDSLRTSVCESEDSFVLSGVKMSKDVMTTVVGGQEMVVMTTHAYCQLLDELHTLKSQLATLSDLLQDNINVDEHASEVD